MHMYNTIYAQVQKIGIFTQKCWEMVAGTK